MRRLLFSLLFVATSTAAQAQSGATATLTSFLQRVAISNTGTTTLTAFKYTLGPAATGRATFDKTGNNGVAGGVASDELSDPTWFQTVSFGGLSLLGGQTQNFGTFDLDFIGQLSPLSVTGQITTGGLDAAYLEATFSNGDVMRASLLDQGWTTTQNLTFSLVSTTVPEPSTYALMALGLAAVATVRRRRQQA